MIAMIAPPATVPRRVTAAGSIDASMFPFEKVVFDCRQRAIVVESLHVAARSMLVALKTNARAGEEQYRSMRMRKHCCHSPDRWPRILHLLELPGRRD